MELTRAATIRVQTAIGVLTILHCVLLIATPLPMFDIAPSVVTDLSEGT
jgi:hypothetical protein